MRDMDLTTGGNHSRGSGNAKYPSNDTFPGSHRDNHCHSSSGNRAGGRDLSVVSKTTEVILSRVSRVSTSAGSIAVRSNGAAAPRDLPTAFR